MSVICIVWDLYMCMCCNQSSGLSLSFISCPQKSHACYLSLITFTHSLVSERLITSQRQQLLLILYFGGTSWVGECNAMHHLNL